MNGKRGGCLFPISLQNGELMLHDKGDEERKGQYPNFWHLVLFLFKLK